VSTAGGLPSRKPGSRVWRQSRPPEQARTRAGYSAKPELKRSDAAASYVRDLIMSGEARAGAYLRPDHLARELGMSNTPVREALLTLRAENFVALEPHRGFVVVQLTPEDVSDLFVTLAFIAGELAARAAAVVTDQNIADLLALQEQLKAAVRDGRPVEVEQLNFEFHRLINVLPQSPKLQWVMSTIVRYSPRRFFARIEGWQQASAEDHDRILQALKARDGHGARAAVHTHMSHAGELLITHLSRRGAWAIPP
jgi:DNA-binding GntR family transcriptional regulator